MWSLIEDAVSVRSPLCTRDSVIRREFTSPRVPSRVPRDDNEASVGAEGQSRPPLRAACYRKKCRASNFRRRNQYRGVFEREQRCSSSRAQPTRWSPTSNVFQRRRRNYSRLCRTRDVGGIVSLGLPSMRAGILQSTYFRGSILKWKLSRTLSVRCDRERQRKAERKSRRVEEVWRENESIRNCQVFPFLHNI